MSFIATSPTAYIVEYIVSRRIYRKQVQYLLKWKGFPESGNTWEPVENLDCQALIEDFERLNQPANKTSRRKNEKKPTSDVKVLRSGVKKVKAKKVSKKIVTSTVTGTKRITTKKTNSKIILSKKVRMEPEVVQNEKDKQEPSRSADIRTPRYNRYTKQFKTFGQSDDSFGGPAPKALNFDKENVTPNNSTNARMSPKCEMDEGESTDSEEESAIHSASTVHNLSVIYEVQSNQTSNDHEEIMEDYKLAELRDYSEIMIDDIPLPDFPEDLVRSTGFGRELEPEKILMGQYNSSGELMFKMKWKDSDLIDLVWSKEARVKCPQVVLDFYESKFKFRTVQEDFADI